MGYDLVVEVEEIKGTCPVFRHGDLMVFLAGLGLASILLGLVGTVLAADSEAAVPDPPDDFVGTAPVSNGSLVALRDGRLMMLASGARPIQSQMLGSRLRLTRPDT